jgi:CDP-diacylglycerol--glycerol-3-phosphate 3-phosphatidyltransferase
MMDPMRNRKVRVVNIPNLLSMVRLVVVPFEFWFAWNGERIPFLSLLGLALFTDSIDGAIARRLKQDSILGARLDSLGDMATYVSLPVCALWLWPDTMRQERFFVILGILSYVVPILAGLLRYRRVTSYHTWGAKLSAVLMGGAVLGMFLFDWRWPFRIFTPVAALAGLEEVLITLTLPFWSANVPSLWHAWRMRGQPPTALE